MHARHLVELAAVHASHRQKLSEMQVEPEFWLADQYWVASRSRLYEWASRLKQCQSQRQDTPEDQQQFWQLLQPVVEEILLAEVATRVWCATLSTLDALHWPDELDPIARSIFVANLEARRRALRLLLRARAMEGVATGGTDRLRVACEAWTDVMLVRMAPRKLALQYCFDTTRVRRLCQDQSDQHSPRADEAWRLELASLRYGLTTAPNAPAACPDLNAQLGSILLGCISPDVFDGVGTPRPGWTVDDACADSLSFNIVTELCGHTLDWSTAGTTHAR